MNTAVILAAGLGSRLKNISIGMPKGFIEFGGQAIVKISINKLKNVGISKIIFGTGHLSQHYETLADNQTIFCVKNKNFATTGSFYTLYNLKNYLDEDFLLLESDILYEKRTLNVLINHLKDDVIIASGKTFSGDEVFIEINKDNCLSTLSKNRSDLSDVYGELVGISKISLESYQEVCKWAKNNIETAKQIHYEEALVNICDKKDIYVEKIEDLVWTEIDTDDHYRKAFDYVYPELLKKENG